eukprot:Nitzschia sp. Nitz4//scaffold47_size129522//46540//47334//NITZ4_003547-RA/size129522-processed-gene-0.39-mRNA-1//-1//CDS//3329552788//1858//frame0
MCFVLLALNQHPKYPFLLASNRDEFWKRPALPLHEWDSGVVAGKDLPSTGTWLAIRQTRFAIVTNVRQGPRDPHAERSRGMLVRDLVESDRPILECLEKTDLTQYAGLNILAGHVDGPVYYRSNRNNKEEIIQLEPGIHALSNASLNTPWPKAVSGKKQLESIVDSSTKQDVAPSTLIDSVLDLLHDASKPHDDHLPDTGIDMDLERSLSSIFIPYLADWDYGTRCSTVLVLDQDKQQICMKERTYPRGKAGPSDLVLDIPMRT